MRAFFIFLFSVLVCFTVEAKMRTYVGSTPAHSIIRNFLGVSSTDSIDFICWKLEVDSGKYKLQCQYGISKPNTSGFLDEKRVAFEGTFTLSNHFYDLGHNNKHLSILELNTNVLHFLDDYRRMLSGNGGYSYALNNAQPTETDEFNAHSELSPASSPLIFEGRTPCQELSAYLGLNKNEDCIKMKWYLHFYTDSVTHKPSYFLMAGMGYRKNNMAKGKWEIVTTPSGHSLFRLYFDRWSRPLDLQKGSENILFFVDNHGHLLTGNADFSYTLNRIQQEDKK